MIMLLFNNALQRLVRLDGMVIDGWMSSCGHTMVVRTHTHTCREADYAKCVRFGIVSQVMALLRQAVRSVAQAGHFLGIRLYQVYSIYLT